MQKKTIIAAVLGARIATVTSHMVLIAALSAPQVVYAASVNYDLPPPYVSRALGAVLVPINHASRHRYQIPPRLHGVYVLAVSPDGVAAQQGIRPGDVLGTVRDHPILIPADIDRLVWSALTVHISDFMFGITRGTSTIHIGTNISLNNFNQSINITNINNWSSVESRNDWTMIVNQFNTNISNSIVDNSYQFGNAIPEPGQNFDGTNRTVQTGTDGLPEPGQNLDGTNRVVQTGTDGLPEPGQDLLNTDDGDDFGDDADDGDDLGDDFDDGDDFGDDTDDGDDLGDDFDDGDDFGDDTDDGDDLGDDFDDGDDFGDDADDGDDFGGDADDGDDLDDGDDYDNADDLDDGDDGDFGGDDEQDECEVRPDLCEADL